MSVVTGSNRRRFQRMDTDFPVSVECGGKRFEARAQNLSQDGLQIEGPTAARVGELFTVTFGKPGATESFRARVTWARPAGSSFEFGCLFWAVEEDAKRQLLVRLIQFSTLHRPSPKPADAPDPATPEAMSPQEAAASAPPVPADGKKEAAPGETRDGGTGTVSGGAGPKA